MSKIYANNRELQEKILSGVNTLANNVASTLGPKGRTVLLRSKEGKPIITKDGVTVAKFVDLEDPFENAAAQTIKQVAAQTNSVAGDGTTTSTVLARALVSKAHKYIVAGASTVELKRGMDKACKEIVTKLEDLSRSVATNEDIEHIATISANGDKAIGKMIAMAADQAGMDGAISVEAGRALETSLDVVEGFRFDSGYFAQAFVNNERRNSIEYEEAIILVTDYKIDKVQDILPVLELAAREGRPLIIVAEEVEGQALAALIMNTIRGSMKVAAVKAPRYGQERRNIMKDLCLSTGARFISRESGVKLNDVKLVDFGQCKKIEVLKNHTTIIDGLADWDKIENKIESLKEEIKQTDDIVECERIQERITRLASGVAIIKVGGLTEIEMVEKKHRIEDALEAVKSAQEEGIVPGGGTALLHCLDYEIEAENEDEQHGAEIVRAAIKDPIRQMASNAGLAPDLIIDKVLGLDPGMGWNFRTDEVVNMIESGIVDPAKVTRVALQNAVSAASTLINTNYAIVEVD